MLRDFVLFIGGAWIGLAVGIGLVFALASGTERYPDGRTYHRKDG